VKKAFSILAYLFQPKQVPIKRRIPSTLKWTKEEKVFSGHRSVKSSSFLLMILICPKRKNMEL